MQEENKQQPVASDPTPEVDNAKVDPAGNLGGGTATPSQQPVEPTTQKTDKPETSDKFTQEQVNEFVRQRLERERNSTFSRYGVKSRDELDSLIGKAQSYGVMKERYEKAIAESNELKEKMAFMRNNINSEKESEIKALFKGYGFEFNEEKLKELLLTHPEWLNAKEVDTTPKTTFKQIGIEHQNINHGESEQQKQDRIFGEI